MKTSKKVLSIVLVLVMVLSLGTTAFAEETTTETTYTLTLENSVAGHTYKVYQLLKGDPSDSDDPASGNPDTLSNITAGLNLKDIVDADGNAYAEGDTKDGVTQKDIDAFIALVQAAVGQEAQGNAAFAGTDTTTAFKTLNGKANADDDDPSVSVPGGYYIIVDEYTTSGVTDGSDTKSRYVVSVVGDTTVSPKVDFPTIDKDIIDTDANAAIANSELKGDTASLGDEIEYEVWGKIPDMTGYTYYYYVLNDTLDKGLTLVTNSFEVAIYDENYIGAIDTPAAKVNKLTTADNGNELVKGTDYYVYTGTDADPYTFKVAFEDLKTLVADDTTIEPGDVISIKYKATVNDNAVIGNTPNKNTAKLEYSNNPGHSERHDENPGTPNHDEDTPTGVGPNIVTKTWITELTIQKINDKKEPLEGAEFTLTGDNLNRVEVNKETKFVAAATVADGKYYKLTAGSYTKDAPTKLTYTYYDGATYDEDNDKVTVTKTYNLETITTVTTSEAGQPNGVKGKSDADGIFSFVGLNAGTYTLEETDTPTGYNTLPVTTVTLSYTYDADTNTLTWNKDNDPNGTGNHLVTIVNYPGTLLPETGGMGTTLFYIVGFLMIAGAGVLLITRRRMANM